MPELSVIVHGPDTRGHLAELLDSLGSPDPLAGCSRPDAEVIVAAVGDWAREAAEGHTHDAVVLPLPAGTDEAAARAAGAARATGRWLHFVPAADGLPAGAPRLIAERTAKLPDTVDVLLLDHLTSTWSTTGIPSADGPLLARTGTTLDATADRAGTTLDASADLLRLTPLIGNRVLRTGFWRAHEERFASDDEAYTAHAALLHARRVACLNQACYLRHVPRPESLPPVTAEQHYALVDRYEALLPLAQDRPAARTVLYDVMVRDLLRAFTREDMPEPVAREFFRRASLAAVRHRPPGHHRPGGLDGIRHGLLEEGAYTKYRAFQAANRTRRAARSAVRTRKRQLGTKLREQQYRRALGRRVNPDLAVFSAYWNRGVACNPAAVAAELARLAPWIHPVWVATRDNAPLLPPGTDHVIPGTRRYWEVLASAKYLTSNVNFPNAVVKRPDAIHLQTHHGTPLKRMGLDQMRHPTAARGMDFAALLARVDKWDYSISANSHSTRMWQRAYPARYTSLDHGYPRNDVYYRARAADVRAVRDRLGIAPGRTAVLYAPTHRDYETGWSPRLDLAALADRLGRSTVLLVRAHYFYGTAGPTLAGLRRTGRIIDVSSYDPVEELCLAADALVTDYSSIMFDYANLDRPIVIYADDWETYAATRGVYFDLTAEAPGQVARTQEDLAEVFASGAWRDEAAAKARAVFRRRFCEYDDGHAAERVVRRVFLGESEQALPPVVPVADRTPAPSPEEATS
jgi:CDP-glycerol glycerophosphotransferase